MSFPTQADEVPVIDVHFHYFMPDVLGPMKEFVIATPEERDTAMAKLVRRKSDKASSKFPQFLTP
jgi:hypothetical protein